jgi:hypothetical protein
MRTVLDRQCDVFDDRYLAAVVGTIAAAHAVHHHHRVRRGIRRAELERKRRRGMRGRDQFHLLERLHPALRLARLGGLCLEAVDKALQMLDRLLLLLIGALLQCELLGPQDLELRVIAAIALDLTVLQMQRNIAHRIEELAVMRDHDERTRIAVQPVFEPDDCIEVEVVRRFVEQQQVRTAHQRLREIQPHAPAARKAAHARARLFEREAKAEQQRFGARRRGVAVRVRERGVRFGFGGAVMRGRSGGNTRFDCT